MQKQPKFLHRLCLQKLNIGAGKALLKKGLLPQAIRYNNRRQTLLVAPKIAALARIYEYVANGAEWQKEVGAIACEAQESR